MHSAGSHTCGSNREVQEGLNDVRRDGGRGGYIIRMESAWTGPRKQWEE